MRFSLCRVELVWLREVEQVWAVLKSVEEQSEENTPPTSATANSPPANRGNKSTEPRIHDAKSVPYEEQSKQEHGPWLFKIKMLVQRTICKYNFRTQGYWFKINNMQVQLSTIYWLNPLNKCVFFASISQPYCMMTRTAEWRYWLFCKYSLSCNCCTYYSILCWLKNPFVNFYSDMFAFHQQFASEPCWPTRYWMRRAWLCCSLTSKISSSKLRLPAKLQRPHDMFHWLSSDPFLPLTH